MGYWSIFIVVMVASWLVQLVLNSRIKKYSAVPLRSGMSGAEVARKMLDDHGLRDITITCTPGTLTDHYNPETGTVNLSTDVYNGRHIAAAAVAAHECGHAVQHARGYAPLKMRSALVPVVSFANRTVQWVILLGMVLINFTPSLLYLGIALFAMTTLFSIITLPVEINASQRAVQWLESSRITDTLATPMAKDALGWAAGTYLVATLSSLATLLYYIAIALSRRN